MKNLKSLGLSVALLCVIATAALADGPPSCDPGETHGPPCTTAQVTPDDSVSPGTTNSPPASNAGSDYSVSEIAADLLQGVLLLF